MIARRVEIDTGHDPYNSIDRPDAGVFYQSMARAKHGLPPLRNPRTREEILAALDDFETDTCIRRGFRYLENHPQIAAEVFAKSLEIARRMEKGGASRFDVETYLTPGPMMPLDPPI